MVCDKHISSAHISSEFESVESYVTVHIYIYIYI
jgi:hypothetical protein